MSGSANDITDFLLRAGLGDLVDQFVAEDIDVSMLSQLDREDLKELGLTIGQRKKLATALTKSRQMDPEASHSGDMGEVPIQLRRLSVMFCDMVGSTQLGERLNIDEMQSLLQHYYDVAHDIAQKHKGHVVGTQGDGVIILFGYPTALEGFAERCVEAAQALQTALVENMVQFEGHDPIRIATRIGIATGQAAVGQADDTLIGEHLRLVGPVVNRAARLQTVANAQSIAVDQKTQELTRHVIHYADVERHDLKGLPAGVEVYHLLGLRSTATGPQSRVELVGRAREIAILHQFWTRAQTGNPGTLTIMGEAGIGKSALIQHFVATQTTQRARVLYLQGTAMTAQSPLRPVAKMFQSLVGDADATSAVSRAFRDADPALVHATVRFLGLEKGSAGDTAVSLKDRQDILELLVRWITEGSDGPTLVVLDNAQWVDDSTRELMTRAADRARDRGAAVLMLATARDTDGAIWQDLPDQEMISLQPLPDSEAEKILDAVIQDRSVPQVVKANILAHSGGNPLMLETLSREQSHMPDAQMRETVEVPYTIYESVSKRLDSIRAGRGVVEVLAVLNTAASQALLAKVLDTGTEALSPALTALTQAGLITRRGDTRDDTVVIAHQVYRDVIYEQITGASRTQLHSAAYAALNALDPSLQTTRPDILALHAQAARDWDHASVHALNAGERLLKQSALIEAGHFLEMADAALTRLPEAFAVRQMRLRAITGLASVERSRFGIATDRSATLGQAAVQLARELGDSTTELLALNGLYAHALVRADYPVAEDYAQALLKTAQRSQSKTFEMIGTRAIGAVAFHRSDYRTAITNLTKALNQYDKQEHLPLAHAHGYDHAEICAAFLSMSHWMVGDLERSQHFSRFSIDHSRDIGHAHSLAQAMAFRVLLGGLAREGSALNNIGAEAVELGEKFDIRVMRAAGLFFPFATQLCLQPQVPDAEDLIELKARLKEFRVVNPFNYGPLVSSLMADVYLRLDDVEAAEKALAEGTKAESYTGETWTSPELLRMRARVSDARGASEAAQTLRKQALKSANDAGAFSLSLRVACDMVEIAPEVSGRSLVQDALDAMVCTDRGWDVTRARSLLQAATLA